MKSLLLSPRETKYASVAWHESQKFTKVRFAVRRPSLAQRIELTQRVRELAVKHEFLTAGDTADKLGASISELLIQKLYIEWGLAELSGLIIDGEPADSALLIEKGPEALVDEIVSAVQAQLTLSEEERKNF